MSASPLAAEESSGPDWSGRANLNLASSYGNSGSGSMGLSAEAGREVGPFRLALDGGLLRATTDRITREAVGTAEAFEVLRRVESRVSADRTHFRARITESAELGRGPTLDYFATAGWERDGPAGIRARYDLTAGFGTSFGAEAEGERPGQVGAGLSYVHQSDEVADPEVGRSSLGLRLDAQWEGGFRTADLEFDGASTWNLRNRDDLRLDVTGAVAFPLSERFAFRTSVQTLLDSRPALERVTLRASPGAPALGRVAVPRAGWDLIVLAALAVRW